MIFVLYRQNIIYYKIIYIFKLVTDLIKTQDLIRNVEDITVKYSIDENIVSINQKSAIHFYFFGGYRKFKSYYNGFIIE